MAGDRKLKVEILGDGTSAERALRDVGDSGEKSGSRLSSALSNAMGQLGLPFTDVVDKMGKKFDEAGGKSTTLVSKLSSIGGGILAATTAGLIGVGAASIEMADKFEPAHANLEAAIKASGSSIDVWGSKIDATDQKMAALGFGMGDVQTALAHSVISTQNTGESLKLMGLAADLARAKHVDLTTATDALDKALTGNSRPLKQMGIDLPVTASNALKLKTAQDALSSSQAALTAMQNAGMGAVGASAKAHAAFEAQVGKVFIAEGKLKDLQSSHTAILDALSQRLGGQASTYAQTFTGRIAAMRAETGNLGIQLGMFLIPKIDELMSVVAKIIGWFEKHRAAAEALGVAVGTVLVGAITIYLTNLAVAGAKSAVEFAKMIAKGAMWVVEASAQPAMVAASNVAGALASAAAWIAANAAMLLATAGIGLAIAAIVVVAVEVYKHWSDITHWISEAWDWVRTEAVRIWGLIEGFFKKWWPEILVIMTGGVALIPVLLIKYWKQISSDVTEAWNAIVAFFTSIPGKVVTALSVLGTDIANVATTAWNYFAAAVVAGWNAEVSFWTGLPGKILAALGDAASWLVSTGGNIVSGLVSGISGAWHQVWDFIKSKLTGLVSSVMSFFGISSPSKMFHGFGVNLMEGLAMGIAAGSGSAHDAMSTATAALANFSVGGSSPSVATGGATTSSPTGPGLTGPTSSSPAAGGINVEINGYNLTDPHKTAAEVSWMLQTAPV